MPYPANACHIVFSGQLSGGEIWSTGFWSVYGVGSLSQLPTDFAAFIDDATANLGDLAGECLDSGSRFSDARAYLYLGGDGQADGQAEQPLNIIGVSASAYPNQTCAVVSLRTGLPGRRFRGRMYWPMLVAQSATHSPEQMGQAKIDELTRNVSEILNFAAANGFSPAVVSRVGVGDANFITSVTCDSKLDTQRRRAESMPALRNSTALVGQV